MEWKFGLSTPCSCIQCSKPEFAFSCIPLNTQRCTSPCGLHLHNMPHRLRARAFPAFRIRAQLHRLLLQPPDPRQLHCFCWSLCLRGQNSESTQRSLSCPRHSASPRASLPRHANRQRRATACRWQKKITYQTFIVSEAGEIR